MQNLCKIVRLNFRLENRRNFLTNSYIPVHLLIFYFDLDERFQLKII